MASDEPVESSEVGTDPKHSAPVPIELVWSLENDQSVPDELRHYVTDYVTALSSREPAAAFEFASRDHYENEKESWASMGHDFTEAQYFMQGLRLGKPLEGSVEEQDFSRDWELLRVLRVTEVEERELQPGLVLHSMRGRAEFADGRTYRLKLSIRRTDEGLGVSIPGG